ncbi:hypothetical protein Tco_0695507 [Tanacetum coccineum]
MILYCLANKVKTDFAKLIWDDHLSKLQKKHREKVVNYSMFISLLLEYKMKDYENFEATSIPTPIFRVNYWTLKKDQPEGPPFTPHMMSIFTADEPEELQAPKSTLQTKELALEGSRPKAKTRGKKSIPLLMNHLASKIEVPFIGPFLKEAIEAQKGHTKNKSSKAKDKNPSQPSVSTHVVTEMHKEALQATNVQTSLGGTGEERVNPQLSRVMSASISITTGVDSEKSAPKDLVPQQLGADEGTNINITDQTNVGTFSQDPKGTTQPNGEELKPTENMETKTPQNDEQELDDLVHMISKTTTKDVLKEWNLDDDQPINVPSSDVETNIFTDSDDENTPKSY